MATKATTLELTSTRHMRTYEIWRRIQAMPLTYEYYATVPGLDGLHAVQRCRAERNLAPMQPGTYMVIEADSMEEVKAR